MAENDFQAAACSGNALSSTGPVCLGSAAGAIPAPVLFSDSFRSDLPSATNFDWSQALLLSSSGTAAAAAAAAAATLQADFVEELSSKPYFYPEAPATLEPINQDVNRAFMVERQHHHIHMNSDSTAVNNFPPLPAHPHSSDDVNQLPSWFRFPHLFDPSSNQSPSHKHKLRYFSDNSHNTTALWNPPLIDDGGFILPPLHNYYSPNSLVPNPNKTIKSISDDVRNLNNYHPAIKKPRVETPSSLPTFKVRKEKLSDRITALQQMVSPFGKTDTASVLFEAIEYIKYLHFEVDEYLKNGNHEQEQEGRKRDLLSRGLCLVPIAAVNIPISANDQSNPPHFWTHSLAESYRYTYTTNGNRC